MAMSASRASGESGFDVMPTVSAPSMFARRTAATVYGVVPEAAMPTTASSALTSAFTAAQQTVYFRNRRVEPSSDYTYDAFIA